MCNGSEDVIRNRSRSHSRRISIFRIPKAPDEQDRVLELHVNKEARTEAR